VSEDRLEEILRTTGRRPEVPRERTLRVEAAVRAEWKAVARARRFRRTLAGVGIAVTVAGAALAWRAVRPPAPAVPPPPLASIEALADAAWSRRNGSPDTAVPVRLGDAVASGDELATSDRGRLALRLAAGHSVRLDGAARVRVLGAATIALDRGSIYVDSHGAPGTAEPLRIRTAAGEIRDVGTQFEVRWDEGSLRIRVREGSVALEDGARKLDVGAGTEIVRAPGGGVSRSAIPPFAEEWRWAAEIAPMLRLEGRSAAEFVAWAARERGLTVRYETRELEESARRIRLNGSIERMTLDQALDSVLPTCRMAYRVDRGEMVVRAREG
jgi:ferric-dicitrate binding protein FerR (iron transport regulator)